MPSRPASHQLENQSRTVFRSVLPDRWQFRDKVPDYGIDGEVEIFDEQHKATGVQFLVQLKAVERRPKRGSQISLEIEWINYYRSLDLPVLIALWVKESNTLSWVWANEIDLFYAKPKAKTFSVRLPNTWDARTPALIQSHIELGQRLRSHDLEQPLKVAARGRPDFRFHVQALCAYAPSLLSYSEESTDVTCTLDKDELKLLFHGLQETGFHSMRKVKDESAAKRVVIGIAMSLANFGALNKAAELWGSVPGLADAVGTIDVAWRVISFLARAGAVGEVRALVAALAPRLGRVPVTMPLSKLWWTAPPHRRSELVEVLAEFETQDLQSEEPEARSIASYNLGKLYGDTHPKRAFGHFATAIRESPFYRDKAYFWAELGAFLFSNRRYHAALRCYRCAYEELGYQAHKSHYADALMHTGRYADALAAFKRIVEAGESAEEDEMVALDVSIATIKARVLQVIVDTYGLPNQVRQSAVAAKAFDEYKNDGVSDTEMLLRIDQVIHLDALYGPAWFIRGIFLNRLGRNAEALTAFLTAAAVRTGHDEAWLNALTLAVPHGQDLLPSLLHFISHQRGEEFLRYLATAAQRETKAIRRALLVELAQVFAKLLPSSELATLRLHHEKTGTPEIHQVPVRRK